MSYAEKQPHCSKGLKCYQKIRMYLQSQESLCWILNISLRVPSPSKGLL